MNSGTRLRRSGAAAAPDEVPANRAYRDAGGPTTQFWELPDAGHTAGLRTHPAEYERRTTAFLDPRPRAQGDLMTILRHALLIGAPLAFSVLLWFHPMLSDYEGLWDVTARFQAVHIGMVLALPLLAVAIYGLLAGLRGRAAAVGRVALIPFVTFYVPYVAFEGIAVGVLGDRSTTSRPASATRSARAWSRISHETPSSASPHAPPLAPIGWACFAAAGWMVLRSDRAPG